MIRSTTTLRSLATRNMMRCAFSTEAEHQPLLSIHGLHARYANATYIAASKAKQLDKVESELLGLAKAAVDSPAFSSLLSNPLIPRATKTAAVAGLDDKLSPVTRNLLTTMAGNARLKELPQVVATYEKLMKAKRGQVDAQIISAEPLSAAQIKSIEKAMKSQVPAGKTVVVQAVTDPSIVGGLQVQIGDQFLDLSVKNRIDEIGNMSLD